ncbi:MAG: hypothetical protein JWQ96_1820 [Segetibacter sp.]|nr:hypothetical protein [Segetibacter sp.]
MQNEQSYLLRVGLFLYHQLKTTTREQIPRDEVFTYEESMQ